MATRIDAHQKMQRFGFLSILATALTVHGQQIAEIDLTQPVPPSRLIHQSLVPKECDTPNFTNSDGEIVSSNNSSHLTLQLKVLNGETFSLGERVKGEVVVRNVGSEEVRIPWTIDPDLSTPKVGSLQHDYDVGWFEVEFKNKDASGVRLESGSVSNFLHSSPSAPGTSLQLEPGQWVVAKFDFILEQDHKSSAGQRLKSGKADVTARWRHALYTWRREGCKIETGYFNYNYKTESKPVVVELWQRPFLVVP